MSSKTPRSSASWQLLTTRAVVATLQISAAFAFIPSGIETPSATALGTAARQISSLLAKPRRLEENVEGALYVNDRVSCCFYVSGRRRFDVVLSVWIRDCLTIMTRVRIP